MRDKSPTASDNSQVRERRFVQTVIIDYYGLGTGSEGLNKTMYLPNPWHSLIKSQFTMNI